MLLRSTAAIASGLLVACLLGGCVQTTSLAKQKLNQGEVAAEPTPAAAFVDAFRRGDETAAERQASPLYHQEWARRKVSPSERESWLPAWHRAGGSLGDWLDVSYVDGFVDTQGKGHLLYVGRSAKPGADASPTVWRLDTDTNGRVVWAEMVWLFSNGTRDLAPLTGNATGSNAGLPLPLARMHPHFVIGIHSAQSWEGFYAVEHTAGDHLALNFFAIDDAGQIRPGAWSLKET
jgi:hypothetical protein